MPVLGEKQKVMVKRRVLLFNFANMQKNISFNYLERSIPDAIIGPLKDTTMFEVMSSELIDDLIKKKTFSKKDLSKESTAIKVGQMLKADIIILGSFVIIGQRMNAQAKAFDTSSSRLIVSRSEATNTDSSMFQAISNLANLLAKEMKEKLPPITQREIIRIRKQIIYQNNSQASSPLAGALWRTTILPGWGHLYNNYWRGWAYLGLWIGSLGYYGYQFSNFSNANKAYNDAGQNSDFNSLSNTRQKAYDQAKIGLLTIAVTYTAVLLDLIFFAQTTNLPKISKNTNLLPLTETTAGLQWAIYSEFFNIQNKARIHYRIAYGKKF